MNNFSLDFLVDYNNEENKLTNNFFIDLCSVYHQTLKSYPFEINLFGVYFFDILKLITQTLLKLKEIQNGLMPNNKLSKNVLHVWPYMGFI